MEQKIRHDLVPAYGLEEVNKVLTQKLQRFDRNEWKYGLNWSDVLSSLKKHLNEFERGEDFTNEGLLNIAEVAANAMIIAEYYSTFPQGDDRQYGKRPKPIIALDLDDTVLSFTESFEEKFGVKLNPYWDGHYKMSEYLKQLETDKDFWVNLKVKNPVGFLPDYYVTARNIPIEWTEECVQKNGLPCVPIRSVPWNVSKMDILKELGVTIMIDDKYQTFKECHENGIFCYLVDSQTNRHYDVGHKRIFDLSKPLK